MSKIPPAVKNAFIVEPLKDKLIHQGRVRDTYKIDDDALLVVATDRISIFGFVLPAQIPRKGEVLTALTHFWLTQILNDLPHHLLYHPDRNLASETAQYGEKIRPERCLLVQKAYIPPYKMVFRWHLGGSAYREYEKTGKISGVAFPAGIPKWERLSKPACTPSTKSATGHDINVSGAEFFEKMGENGWRASLLFELAYNRAYIYAASRGVLILDTKFEGLDMIADEVLTPDSSRFTTPDSWRKAISLKKDPDFYDKEPIRNWGKTVPTPFTENSQPVIGINNLNPERREHLDFVHAIAVPQYILLEASERYKHIFERLTGMTLLDYQQKYLL